MSFEGVLEEVTTEFVDFFWTNASAYESTFAKMVTVLGLPAGVDADDPRVIEIVKICAEKHAVGPIG